ncbi:hypothetical protein BGY98DRAFT_1176639 [Russula aff. rugulosa BPL654]|nr:hypothetical protein BGY98DRAFT_1176639 [Russula aff. rugulosa BPL654]
MGGGDEDEDTAIRATTTRPYSSPCKIVAERPKLTREPLKEVEVEAVAKETLRKARVEAAWCWRIMGGRAREGKPYVREEREREESQVEKVGRARRAGVKRSKSGRSVRGKKEVCEEGEDDQEPTWERRVRPAEERLRMRGGEGVEGAGVVEARARCWRLTWPVRRYERGREFMGKTSIIAVKGWRVDMKRGVTVSESTSPVCEGNGSEVTEKGKVMIKVTNKADNSSRVIEAGDGWKVKAMKMKRCSKELRVEGKGKIEVAMNLHQGEARAERLSGVGFWKRDAVEQAAEQSEGETTVENWELEGIDDITEAVKLTMWVISSNTHNGNLTHHSVIGKHIIRVNRRHECSIRSIWDVKKEKMNVVGRNMWGGDVGLVCGEDKSVRMVLREVIKPMVSEASSEGGLKG